MTFWILTVILVEGLFCGISHAADKPVVRCEASAVYMGGEGQVTCHYPMDLSHIDCIVSIEQFVDDSEITVLDCVRDRISQCDVRQGYRVTNLTGNTLTVTIPKVTDEHMGRYGCSLADRMTSYGYDLCTFEVKNRKSRCEASVENIGGRGQVTCHYPMDLTKVHCVVDIVQFVDGAETHILSCLWEDIIQRDCTDVRQGYRITNFTGNTLTVTIPKVTDEHRGRYRCSLVDEIIHDYELCDVVEKRTTPHSSQPGSSMEKAVADQSGSKPHSSQPESSTEKAAGDQSDADKGMPGGIIALLVIYVIVITVVSAVIFWIYRRRRCQKRNNPAQAPAKFVNSADSQKNEVYTVGLDILLKDTHAFTGGKDTVSADSGYGDTKTENGDTTGSREEDDHSRYISLENKEMAENAERQDAASGAEGTADNRAPLLSVPESRYDQDAEEEEEERDGLLASGDPANLDKNM